MQTQSWGQTGWTVSRLAYGGWRLDGPEGHPLNDGGVVGVRAVLSAADAGYTVFDLADIYGGGESERIFGLALRARPGLRDQVRVVSKCSIRRSGDPGPTAPYRYDASADYIVRSVEGSLARMGISELDVLLLHRPDYLLDPDEVARAFEQLRQAGKVREFGVSNFRPGQWTALQRACSRPLVTHQVQISLAHRESLEDGVLDQCLAERITPMAWSPLARGELLLDEVPGAPNLRPVLNAVADELGVTPSIVALAWLLRHPAAVMPVVGTVQPDRIKALAAAPGCHLSRETWYRLLEAARGTRLP